MTIRALQKNFEEDAAFLGNYQAMSKLELANGYCDADEAHDEPLRSAYFSALMLRYWYKIWEWQKDSISLHLKPTDFVDWLVDSLTIAFIYRTWRYKYKAKVSLKNNGKFEGWELDEHGNKIPNPYYWEVDPTAPDKIINRCCFSTRGREYQYHNKEKRKANVGVSSLDSMVDENGDHATQEAGCVVQNKHVYDDPTYLLVNALFAREELIEGLIIDGIAYGDSFKEIKNTVTTTAWDDELQDYVEKEVEKTAQVFDPRKLVKHLSHLDENYIFNYCHSYDIPKSVGTIIYSQLKKLNNKKLYALIKKVQIEVTTNTELKNCLVAA